MRWLWRLSFALVLLLSTCAASTWAIDPIRPDVSDVPPKSPHQAFLPVIATDLLAELLPGMAYGAWYTANTHYEIGDYFAAYAFAPLDDTLYVGFGTARPAETDGALLAASDGITITAVYTPSEQGFIDMSVVGQTIYFPGPDPCCEDDWQWGNFYKWPSPNPKIRNLPNVLHTWGEWYDTDRDMLYIAVGACHEDIPNPDYETCEGHFLGKVFSSTDGAETWTQIARGDVESGGIGQYRTYDVIGFENRLYVVWNDVYEEPCGLAVSADDGHTWTRLPDLSLQTACRSRLVIYDDRLLILRTDRAAHFAIGPTGELTTHEIPGFRIADWAYNHLAEDGAGRLYTISDDGRVLRTADLETWEMVAARDLTFTTVGYWPARDWLVLGDRGADAKLWKINLAADSATSILQTPTVLAVGRDAERHWVWPAVTPDLAAPRQPGASTQ